VTRIHVSHCHPLNPSIICPGRAESRSRGAFWWDMRIGGYVSSDIPARTLSWRAKYFDTSTASDGDLYRLEICPWCGMQLPELFPAPDEMSCSDGFEE
jgi:hypothetical protein